MTTKKRPVRSKVDNKYHIDGNTYDKVFGERRDVWARRAYKTAGGLKRSDLVQNSTGRIISKKKHEFEKSYDRLLKHGWTACKGHFGGVPIKKNQTKAKACKEFLTKKKKMAPVQAKYMTRSVVRKMEKQKKDQRAEEEALSRAIFDPLAREHEQDQAMSVVRKK